MMRHGPAPTLRFYDIRDCRRWEQVLLDSAGPEPVMESSEELHNEWVEPVQQPRGEAWHQGAAENPSIYCKPSFSA